MSWRDGGCTSSPHASQIREVLLLLPTAPLYEKALNNSAPHAGADHFRQHCEREALGRELQYSGEGSAMDERVGYQHHAGHDEEYADADGSVTSQRPNKPALRSVRSSTSTGR